MKNKLLNIFIIIVILSCQQKKLKTLDIKTEISFEDLSENFKSPSIKYHPETWFHLNGNNISKEDVNWLVPHQANKRIIEATANRIGLDDEKVMMNISRYGNTTSATLPLLLADYENQLKKGDNLIFAAFGGGFTWGAAYVKWAYDS